MLFRPEDCCFVCRGFKLGDKTKTKHKLLFRKAKKHFRVD